MSPKFPGYWWRRGSFMKLLWVVPVKVMSSQGQMPGAGCCCSTWPSFLGAWTELTALSQTLRYFSLLLQANRVSSLQAHCLQGEGLTPMWENSLPPFPSPGKEPWQWMYSWVTHWLSSKSLLHGPQSCPPHRLKNTSSSTQFTGYRGWNRFFSTWLSKSPPLRKRP